MVEENIFQEIIGNIFLVVIEKANALIPEWVVPVSMFCLLTFLFLILWARKIRKKDKK